MFSFNIQDLCVWAYVGLYNDEVNSKLWQMGLVPKSTITVNHKESDYMFIQCNGHTLEVPTEIARRINIEQIEKMV